MKGWIIGILIVGALIGVGYIENDIRFNDSKGISKVTSASAHEPKTVYNNNRYVDYVLAVNNASAGAVFIAYIDRMGLDRATLTKTEAIDLCVMIGYPKTAEMLKGVDF